ncbi:MAG TPA: hypothetical protein PLW46_02845 [Acinetobacter johnsonii]|nr:hypothetical protein [Acinetobacter johnsonii]
MKNERKDQSQTPLNQSTITGDNTPHIPPLTVEQLAEALQVSIEKFMRENYITGIEVPKNVTIEKNSDF